MPVKPALHLQASRETLAALELLSAGHSSQDVAAAAAYLPAGQAPHSLGPLLSLKVPPARADQKAVSGSGKN